VNYENQRNIKDFALCRDVPKALRHGFAKARLYTKIPGFNV
jgi:hypothetical protein